MNSDLSDGTFAPPAMGEPYLLTPGPLTTAHEVKAAMLDQTLHQKTDQLNDT